MSDIKLTKEGDLVINDGKLVLTESAQEDTRQQLSITLNAYRGEWFLDEEFGLPYFQTILRKGTDKDTVDALIKSTIEEQEGIVSLVTFESSITLGRYSCFFTASVPNGEKINQNLNIDI